ncbi:MAG: helix-turn-helix transcriptional regulator [Oscillospiraceae bacterium]|nr:helix-turn-helix transcriptional regulator [Oscillospiraceae bacterium]
MTVYQRLKDLREDMDITQKDVAEFLGMKQSQYSLYETGQRKLSVSEYIRLAEFYNVSLDYITGRCSHKSGVNRGGLSEDEELLIKKYRQLKDSERIRIHERMDIFLEDK